MKACSILPEGYSEYFKVDLKKNKKQAVFVNVLSILIAVAVVVPACFFVPITTLFSFRRIGTSLLKLGLILVFMIIYLLLHELTHGIAMKLCGTKRVRYGFTVIYAYAGSDDYYGKGAYIFIALAPVVLFFALLSVACVIVPASWFWVVYFIQIMNLSGAAGDLYVTFKFLRFPRDILIRDSGVSMVVYSKGGAMG